MQKEPKIPRAMIVASKGLKISLIESLTSRDITSINLHNSDGEIIVCSAYQNITFPEVINNIDKCVEHSKATNKEVIIGSDSNAHSDLWMSESTNSRGEIFEESLLKSKLVKKSKRYVSISSLLKQRILIKVP